jgi:uncharacterized protein YecE (DUF72 family)
LIGCAGWSFPVRETDAPGQTHLERYARRFSAVEINTSFYRPHQRKTYVRWAASVGDDFRFSVKVPKAMTHEWRLEGVDDLLAKFVDEVSGLGEKLGCLLIQLPPSLEPRSSAGAFFESIRRLTGVDVVCEPRHPDWFTTAADDLLAAHGIGRVIADPSLDRRGLDCGPDSPVTYIRLHGAPKIYYSNYDDASLATWGALLRKRQASGHRCWCVFDNTAAGHALENAAELDRKLNVVSPATTTVNEA